MGNSKSLFHWKNYKVYYILFFLQLLLAIISGFLASAIEHLGSVRLFGNSIFILDISIIKNILFSFLTAPFLFGFLEYIYRQTLGNQADIGTLFAWFKGRRLKVALFFIIIFELLIHIFSYSGRILLADSTRALFFFNIVFLIFFLIILVYGVICNFLISMYPLLNHNEIAVNAMTILCKKAAPLLLLALKYVLLSAVPVFLTGVILLGFFQVSSIPSHLLLYALFFRLGLSPIIDIWVLKKAFSIIDAGVPKNQ